MGVASGAPVQAPPLTRRCRGMQRVWMCQAGGGVLGNVGGHVYGNVG